MERTTGIYLHIRPLTLWQGSPILSLQEQIDTLQSDNAVLVEDWRNINGDLINCYQEKEELKTEISRLEGNLSDANTSVASHQEAAEKWRVLAEYYRNSLIQWSDGINQISLFLQSLKSEIPEMPLGYDWIQ